MKYKHLILFFIVSCCLQGAAQGKYEREYRIKKTEFPEIAHALLANEIPNAKRLRYYRETDSTTTRFEARFKKDRLHYSMEFNANGILKDVEIQIKEIDIPNDTFASIKSYLTQSLAKYQIRKIQQQYLVVKREEVKKSLREAFQNLLLPSVNYKLMVSCKTEDGHEDIEFLFDSAGTYKNKRILLPPNYDHILY